MLPIVSSHVFSDLIITYKSCQWCYFIKIKFDSLHQLSRFKIKVSPISNYFLFWMFAFIQSDIPLVDVTCLSKNINKLPLYALANVRVLFKGIYTSRNQFLDVPLSVNNWRAKKSFQMSILKESDSWIVTSPIKVSPETVEMARVVFQSMQATFDNSHSLTNLPSF